MQNLKIPAIIFTAFFLFGCGPSEEEIAQQTAAKIAIQQAEQKAKEQAEADEAAELEAQQKAAEEASVLSTWNSALDMFKRFQDDESLDYLADGVEFYMTSDGRGVVFRESRFEMMGLIAFNTLYLGIPDYIREQISNTAPIDGNQKARYDNVEINWSVNRTGSTSIKTIKIYISLRLID